MDGWIDGWIDGWLDGGWMDGCMDGWMDVRIGPIIMIIKCNTYNFMCLFRL